jgi:hypothetical protein
MKEFEVLCLSNYKTSERMVSQAIVRVLPFTPVSVNGKTYLITRADVSLEAPRETPHQSVGLVFDKENGWEYALNINDLNQFMATGNLSLLPKESTRSSRVETLQLRELCLPTETCKAGLA